MFIEKEWYIVGSNAVWASIGILWDYYDEVPRGSQT